MYDLEVVYVSDTDYTEGMIDYVELFEYNNGTREVHIG